MFWLWCLAFFTLLLIVLLVRGRTRHGGSTDITTDSSNNEARAWERNQGGRLG